MQKTQLLNISELISFISQLPESASLYDVSDSSFSLVYANDSFYSMVERSREDSAIYTGSNATKSIHPEDLPLIQSFFEHIKKGIYTFDEDIRLLKKANSYIWVHVKIQCIQADNGVKTAFVIFTPVTSKNNSPLISRLDINKLSKFIEDMPAGLSVIYVSHNFSSINNIKSFHSYVNKGYLHVHFQNENNDIYTNQDVLNNVHPDDIQGIRNKYLEVKKNSFKTNFDFMYRALCGDGKYHWLQALARCISTTDQYDIFYTTVVNADKIVSENESFKSRYLAEKEKMNAWAKDKFLFCSFNISKNLIEELNTFNNIKVPPEDSHTVKDAVDFLLTRLSDANDYGRVSAFLSKENIQNHYVQRKMQFSIQYQQQIHGFPVWVELSVVLLKQPQANDIIGFATLSDINEKKQNENLLKRIISIDYDNVVIIRLQDEFCYTVFSRNEKDCFSFVKNQNYTKDLSLYLKDFFTENEAQNLSKSLSLPAILQALSTENIYFQTFAVKTPDGIKNKKILFTFADQTKQFIYLVQQDVTDVLKSEEKQQKLLKNALDEAEKANFTKKEFLSHVSHDIRTPLHAIIGLTNLAKDVKDKPDEVLYFLNKIDISGQLLTGLFNDVIDMAQIEQGHIDLHPESYRYEDFKASIISPFEVQCKEKHISLIYDKTEGFPVVLVDRQRFNQIFYNLFSNAIKYTVAGDTISFKIENPRIESHLFVAEYVIEDSGSGISISLQKQLESLFKNENTGELNITSGFGLGLLIVKSFVSLLGGKISVSTTPGVGTKFLISMALPLAQSTAKENTYIEDFSMLAGKTILLVEDNDLNREIACRQLEKKNMRVIQAINGEDAVKIFTAAEPGTFNAVLMDIQMPVMNGYEAAKAIRSLNRVDALITPIIAMSANGFVEDIKNSLAAGMVAHLTKPIDLNRLYGTLAAFCTN